MIKRYIVLLLALILGIGYTYTLIKNASNKPQDKTTTPMNTLNKNGKKPEDTTYGKIPLKSPNTAKILENNYHIFQTFNNCGPAALSMALSYYDINVSQQTLGQRLRPYQNPQGDNDDKSVTLEEIAKEAKKYNLTAYLRPNGNIETIKLFITYEIPIITRTLLTENEDIGHYRVIKGYDDTKKIIIQDDSLQGSNLEYTYTEFNKLWKTYNYEYLVLIPEDKLEAAREILGHNFDYKTAWETAEINARNTLQINPNDIYERLNLSIALYNTGKPQEAIVEYEKIQDKLPNRTLWYQIEPIKAYYEVGDYDKVFSITDSILIQGNRAYSELYLIRGQIYLDQKNKDKAKEEFEKAVLYNNNLEEAKEALNSL